VKLLAFAMPSLARLHAALQCLKSYQNVTSSQHQFCFAFQHRSTLTIRGFVTECQSFEKLGISKPICQRLKQEFHIDNPTDVQSQLIPAIFSGNDVLLRDLTGTGKSFAIAMSLVANDTNGPSMYMAPNRELALQVAEWIDKLAPHARVRLAIAGEHERSRGSNDELPSLLTVGTASHIWSLIQERHLKDSDWKTIVVDEADQAFRLPGRFANWKKRWNRKAHPKPAESVLESIISSQQSKPQIIISSATMNRPLRHWLQQKKWIKNPKFIDGRSVNPTAAAVQHHCIIVSSDQVRNVQTVLSDLDEDDMHGDGAIGMEQDIDDSMMECLETLCNIEPVQKAIIFVHNDGSFTKTLHKLQHSGIDAISLYDSIANNQSARFYVATAITGRGIDLQDISHVFIVGLPGSIGDYMHMAGRLGRLGQTYSFKPRVMTLAKDSKYTESKVNKMFKLMNVPITQYTLIQ